MNDGFDMMTRDDHRSLVLIVFAALAVGVASVSFGLWMMQ